jgi:hypothetical protein
MNKEQFTKGITYLGIAYNKEFNQKEVETFYDFLKDYDYETFKIAIKEIIKDKKFMPSISEMIEFCNKNKQQKKFEILEKMKLQGYFKDLKEYEKAIRWLESGNIPSWFKEDIKQYNNTQQIEYKPQLASLEEEQKIKDLLSKFN